MLGLYVNRMHTAGRITNLCDTIMSSSHNTIACDNEFMWHNNVVLSQYYCLWLQIYVIQ
jgi:hypothetical protein